MNGLGYQRSTLCRKNFVLAASLGVIFVAICCVIYYYTIQQEREVREKAVAQFESEIDAIIELEDRANIANIVDISYWDECIRFVNTKDDKWFLHNVVYAMDTYDADYMAIYGPDGDFIRKQSTKAITTVDFIPKDVFPILREKRLMKFHIRIPEGYAQVFGCTVHPTADVLERKTPAEGYFFIIKLLNDDYFAPMQPIYKASISLGGSMAEPIDHTITAIRPLKDFEGNVINHLNYRRNFDVSFYITKGILILMMVLDVLSISIFLMKANKWIYRPLHLVKKVLESGDRRYIDALRKAPGEFGYIGRLFSEYKKQKLMLEAAKLKAEESDRLKSSFLTNISHEIRTPMNAITGFSELLLNPEISEREKAEYIKIINSSGRNLVSVIDDLIEMSKIDTNQVTPNYSAVDIDAIVDELYQSIKISIPEKKAIDFQVRKPVNPLSGKIITDNVKLRQILVNLVTNAVKYTEHGFVLFGYEVDESRGVIEFMVQDSGIGIDEVHHQKIFERFHRIENDYTIKAGGLGLGLAISKAYVNMLGGEISFESSPVKGTTFTFTLPIRYADIPEEKTNEFPIPVRVRPVTVLVAEDDNINFLLMQKLLRMQQHIILRAKDGQEAVDICQANPNIDVVLMDIKMPVLDGYQAFSQIKLFRPNLPVIAQTAYASIEDQKKIHAFGFAGYISKPINKDELFEMIGSVASVKVVI